jgi:regulatory protein
VLTLLEEQKLTNDADFASALINDRIKSKPVGKRVLAGKLFEKGVPKNISEEAIKKAFDEIDEKSLALASFEKYSHRLKGKEVNEQKRKTFDYLMRKGFETDIIIEIIREKIPQT